VRKRTVWGGKEMGSAYGDDTEEVGPLPGCRTPCLMLWKQGVANGLAAHNICDIGKDAPSSPAHLSQGFEKVSVCAPSP
jgi:hypothetical protein